MAVEIRFFSFLLLVLKFWSVSKALDFLFAQHSESSGGEIIIPLWVIKIRLLFDSAKVKAALSSEIPTTLTFANDNFFAAHDHPYGIGNLDQKNPYWGLIHQSLAAAIGPLDNISDLVRKHSSLLISNKLNDLGNKYVQHFWTEFTFGPNVTHREFLEMRTLLIGTLRNTFYFSRFRSVPFFGYLLCRFYRWKYQKELREIDNQLKTLINRSGGFVGRFQIELKKYIFNDDLIDQIVLDNTFLSVLGYDFLAMFVAHALIDMSQKQLTPEQRLNHKTEYLKSSFLFPRRLRYDPKTGDYLVLDLVRSGHLFSYGPRACVGQMLTMRFYNETMNLIKDFTITDDRAAIVLGSDPDIRPILSHHILKFSLPTDYLAKHLDFCMKKDNSGDSRETLKFYRIEGICENQIIYNYILEQMTDDLMSQQVDCIVTADARGFLFASPVASRLNLPLITARKKGKLCGPTIEASYHKAYGSLETIEISMNSDLKRRCVIIDDGVASGGTLLALYELITKQGGTVIGVRTAVRHHYCACQYHGSGIKSVFDL